MPSVTERNIDLTVQDLQGKYTKASMAMSRAMDVAVAKRGLQAAQAKGFRMLPEGASSKEKRRMLERIADEIDLTIGGTTKLQTPAAYRNEGAKLILQYTGAINSKFQKLLEAMRVNKGNIPKQAALLTAVFFAAYAEVSISKMSLGFEDPEQRAIDTTKGVFSNVPGLGQVLFALDTGDYNPIPVAANISEAFKRTNRFMNGDESAVSAAYGWMQVAGAPKQLRKTIEGIGAGKGIKGAIAGKNFDYSTADSGSTSGTGGLATSGGLGRGLTKSKKKKGSVQRKRSRF